MKKIHYFKSYDELKAFFDPMKSKVMQVLTIKTCSIKMLANILNEKSSVLQYHIKELLKLGLIKVEKKVEIRNLTEKHYRSIAKEFYANNKTFDLLKKDSGYSAKYHAIEALLSNTSVLTNDVLELSQYLHSLTDETVNQLDEMLDLTQFGVNYLLSIPHDKISDLLSDLTKVLRKYQHKINDKMEMFNVNISGFIKPENLKKYVNKISKQKKQ